MVDLSLLRTETVTEMDLTRDDLQCHYRMFFGVQDYYNHSDGYSLVLPGLKLMIIFMLTSKMYELFKTVKSLQKSVWEFIHTAHYAI